jgi:YHS domain-containing protein
MSYQSSQEYMIGSPDEESNLLGDKREEKEEVESAVYISRWPHVTQILTVVLLLCVSVFAVSYTSQLSANDQSSWSASFTYHPSLIGDNWVTEIPLENVSTANVNMTLGNWLEGNNGNSSCTCYTEAGGTIADHGGVENGFSTDLCTDPDAGPVMQGVDLVEYFNRAAQGDTYLEYSGDVCDGSIETNFAGYTFYFKSEANKALFDANPITYVPQFGGFCTLGITAEFCPAFQWDKSCLGPKALTNAWQILDGKLYFFMQSIPLTMFNENPYLLIDQGTKRWADFFGVEESQGVYHINTACYNTQTVTTRTRRYG